jgi:hypothetical protein
MNRISWFLLLGVVALAGCGSGPRLLHVFGNITFEGKPIENGTIEFIPADGTPGPSMGSSIKDGKYEIAKTKGPHENGVYQVRITNMRKTGKKTRNFMAPGGPLVDVEENVIPAKYNAQSTLKVTMTPDNAAKGFNFDL